MAHAIGIIHEKNGVFGISFPDFPGCTSTGATFSDAMIKGEQALAFHIEGMAEDGEVFPQMSTLDQVRARDPEGLEGGVAVAVPVRLPENAARYNITMDKGLMQAVDRAADAQGMTRSGFLADAVRRALFGDQPGAMQDFRERVKDKVSKRA